MHWLPELHTHDEVPGAAVEWRGQLVGSRVGGGVEGEGEVVDACVEDALFAQKPSSAMAPVSDS